MSNKSIYKNNIFLNDKEDPFFKALWGSSQRYQNKKLSELYYIDKKEIYHYTDMNGFLGITESRGFWLSSILYLNDEEEIYNGIKIVKNLIKKLQKKGRYKEFKDVLIRTNEYIKNFDFTNIYIASFSQKNDDLEQWRAYSKNGSGVCIGFNVHAETNYPHFSLRNGPCLYKVIYNDDIKNWILLSIIFKYNYEYKKDKNKFADNDDYARELAHALARVFVHFKNTAFQSEQEVRLVLSLDKDLEYFNKKYFRNVNNVIVPYICTNDTSVKRGNTEIEVDKLPISSVIIGPTLKQKIVRKSIEDYLEYKDYKKEIVSSSSIPYRG